MEKYKIKTRLPIAFLAAGFFLGILYENMIEKSKGGSIPFFEGSFLSQYHRDTFMGVKYLWYVTRARILQLLGICFVGAFRWKKVLVLGILFWTGCLGGILFVSAVVSLGVWGILVCLATIFPHIAFYGITWSAILLFWYQDRERKWNLKGTFWAAALTILGILAESYLSPFLVSTLFEML